MTGSSSRLPTPADVIEYAFLWEREAARGLAEGLKSRPCLVLATEMRSGVLRVAVAPITSARQPFGAGVEVPAAAGARLGLRTLPSWIAFTDVNEFTWPGPDLRPAGADREPFWLYGMVSHKLHRYVRQMILARCLAGSSFVVRRTD